MRQEKAPLLASTTGSYTLKHTSNQSVVRQALLGTVSDALDHIHEKELAEMADQKFSVITDYDPGTKGKTRSIKPKCSVCGTETQIKVSVAADAVPAEMGEKLMRRLGWEPGKNRDRDLCPDHSAAGKRRKVRETSNAPRPRRGNVVRSAILAAQKAGVANPKEGVHYRIMHHEDGYVYQLIPKLQVQEPAPATAVVDKIPLSELMLTAKASTEDAPSYEEEFYAPTRHQPRLVDLPDLPDASMPATPEPKPVQPAPEPEPEPVVAITAEDLDRPAVGAPGRTRTRAQNRTIMDALERYYDEDAQGYSADWTDQKLSDHLDLPRIWVAEVREQFFGPAGSVADKQLRADLGKVLSDLDNLETRFLTSMSDFEKEHRALKDRFHDINSRINQRK